MKLRINLSAIAFFITLLFSPFAHAAEEGWFMTAGAGAAFLDATTVSGTSINSSDHFTYNLGYGYQFGRLFSAELNYQDYTSQGSTTGNSYYLDNYYNYGTSVDDIHGYTINLLGTLKFPVAEGKTRFFLKYGQGYTRISQTVNVTHPFYRYKDEYITQGVSFSYGAGIEQELNEHFAVSLGYLGTTMIADDDDDYYDSSNRYVNNIMANLIYWF